jgi:hypothetical protein
LTARKPKIGQKFGKWIARNTQSELFLVITPKSNSLLSGELLREKH